MLQADDLISNVGVDAAENEPSNVPMASSSCPPDPPRGWSNEGLWALVEDVRGENGAELGRQVRESVAPWGYKCRAPWLGHFRPGTP